MDIVEIAIASALFACTLSMLICTFGAIIAIAHTYTGCLPQ
jgi:hypothetical protein